MQVGVFLNAGRYTYLNLGGLVGGLQQALYAHL